MKNPWTIKSSKTIYDNPWIEVIDHKVLNAAGKPGVYGKVHFKNVALGIIPLSQAMETVLVGQYRFPLEEYSWEIPEGGGKLEIDPLESAKRELKEETGIVARRWDQLLKIHTSNSVSDEYGLIYLARDLEFKDANPDEDEVLTLRKLPFKEAVQMVLNGEITDSLSVSGILKLNYLLEKELI